MTGAEPRHIILGEREERDQIIRRDLGRARCRGGPGAKAGQRGVRQEPHGHDTPPNHRRRNPGWSGRP